MDSDLPVPTRRAEQPSQAVEGLLANPGDWRNIQNIIRVTFKALADAVKRQELQLCDLERRHEDAYTALSSSLQHKVSEPELMSALSDLERRINLKPALEALESAISEKLSQEDVQTMLRPKANIDEVARLMEQKAQKWDTEASLADMSNRLGEFTEEFSQKLSAFALRHDLDSFAQVLESKASTTQLEDGLSKKANSDTVASFLRKKANRDEIEASLSRKADLTTVKDLIAAVESKADQSWVEQLAEIVDLKADRKELTDRVAPEIALKANKNDVEELAGRLKEAKSNSDKKTHDISRSLDLKTNAAMKEIESLKIAIEKLQSMTEQTKTALEKAVGRKADMRDLDNLAGLVGKKADLEYMAEVVAMAKDEMLERMDSHLSAAAVQKNDVFEDIMTELNAMKTDQVAMASDIHEISDKCNCAEEYRRRDSEETTTMIKSLVTSLMSDLQAESDRMRQDLSVVLQEMDSLASTKSDKVDIESLRDLFRTSLLSKPDISYLDSEVSKSQQVLLVSLQSLKDDIRKKLNSIEAGLQKQVETRVTMIDFQTSIGQVTAEQARVSKALGGKADHSELEGLIAALEELRNDLGRKASGNEFSMQVAVLKSALDEAARDIAGKANLADVCGYLDSKANVDDINSALKSLQDSCAQKVSIEEFRETMKVESQVLEGIVSRCLEGRWAWNSGELKANGTVPWETQSLNNAPDMFVWERGKPAILVTSPGLYEVSFAFFSRKKPAVQLMVNSEIVVNPPLGITPTRKGAPISGLSVIEYLLLPARARITIVFSGETIGEGFLGLRKV